LVVAQRQSQARVSERAPEPPEPPAAVPALAQDAVLEWRSRRRPEPLLAAVVRLRLQPREGAPARVRSNAQPQAARLSCPPRMRVRRLEAQLRRQPQALHRRAASR
jgi:hypothetical protein